MSCLIVVLVLGLLILVHEAGHLAAARAAGIPVARFSIGFGPALWRWERGTTEYRLSLIPLGGYVLPDLEDEAAYFRVPVGRRVLLALGGPAANVVAVPLLLALAGLLRDGPSLAGLVTAPNLDSVGMFRTVFSALPALFSRPGELSGIVGIVAQGSQIVDADAVRALSLAAFLSVNLAVLNLLPLPALDGGKILLSLLEKIHPRLARLHLPLTLAGWVLLLGLLAYVTVLDVGRLLA